LKVPIGIRKVSSYQHPGYQKESLPCYSASGNERDFDGRIFEKIFDHAEILKYYRGEVPEEVSHCDPFPEKTGLIY
jgi:hypothetical protein